MLRYAALLSSSNGRVNHRIWTLGLAPAKLARMRSARFSCRSAGAISAAEVLFFFFLLLFLVVVCVWPILTWRLHHFSTWSPNATHSYAVHDRTGLVYLAPAFGKFFISLPWLWGSLLVATILTGMLSSRKSGSAK
jgi:hypothetical protein